MGKVERGEAAPTIKKSIIQDEGKTLQKLISFIIYTSVCMLHQYRHGAVLVTALGGARLYMFTIQAKAAVINSLETWFSALVMDSSEEGRDVKQRCYESNI